MQNLCLKCSNNYRKATKSTFYLFIYNDIVHKVNGTNKQKNKMQVLNYSEYCGIAEIRVNVTKRDGLYQ